MKVEAKAKWLGEAEASGAVAKSTRTFKKPKRSNKFFKNQILMNCITNKAIKKLTLNDDNKHQYKKTRHTVKICLDVGTTNTPQSQHSKCRG